MNTQYRRGAHSLAASQVMFHATPIENEFGIIRNGLLASKAKALGSGVFLTNTKPEPKDGLAVFAVEVTGLPLKEDRTGQPSREGEFWFVTSGDIPTFRIRSASKADLYERTSKVQQQLNERYHFFKEALLVVGFTYDAQYSRFNRGQTIVWHSGGHPYTQYVLDMLLPFSHFTIRHPGVIWRQIDDTVERTQEQVVEELMLNIAQMSLGMTDAAVAA